MSNEQYILFEQFVTAVFLLTLSHVSLIALFEQFATAVFVGEHVCIAQHLSVYKPKRMMLISQRLMLESKCLNTFKTSRCLKV